MGDDGSVVCWSKEGPEPGAESRVVAKADKLGKLCLDATFATRWSRTDRIGTDRMKKRK
jgi:hypothetical protein